MSTLVPLPEPYWKLKRTWTWEFEGSGEILYRGIVSDLLSESELLSVEKEV